jgi:hypothetical protein
MMEQFRRWFEKMTDNDSDICEIFEHPKCAPVLREFVLYVMHFVRNPERLKEAPIQRIIQAFSDLFP